MFFVVVLFFVVFIRPHPSFSVFLFLFFYFRVCVCVRPGFSVVVFFFFFFFAWLCFTFHHYFPVSWVSVCCCCCRCRHRVLLGSVWRLASRRVFCHLVRHLFYRKRRSCFPKQLVNAFLPLKNIAGLARKEVSGWGVLGDRLFFIRSSVASK